LPSTTGTGAENAMLAIAPAEYGPTPGRLKSSSTERGSSPAKRSTTACAARRKLRARE
jgi:hypothetical protein